ncbi:MAG TPA: hypothetical protein VII33_20095, partial [Nakamurella sp.]
MPPETTTDAAEPGKPVFDHPGPGTLVDRPGPGGSAPDGSGSDEVDIDAVVALAADLVRMRTVNAAGAQEVETPAVQLLADLMRGFGWAVTVTEVAPGRHSVVGVVDGSQPRAGAGVAGGAGGPVGGDLDAGRTLMFE